MNIREANEGDVATLSALATETYITAFGHSFTPEELQQKLEETRSEKYFADALKRDVILLAEESGQMVGYAEFGPPNLERVEGIEIVEGDMELSRLYVDQKLQRKGIGKALLDAAFAYLQMQNAPNIYLDVWTINEAAIRLYEQYGFRDTGKRDEHGDMIMVRKSSI